MKNLILIAILSITATIASAQWQKNICQYDAKNNLSSNSSGIFTTKNNSMSLPPRYRNGSYRGSSQDGYLTCGYVNMGLGGSDGLTAGIGLNCIWENNWGGSFSYNYLGMDANELPSDYHSGLFQSEPKDKLNTFSLRIMREIPTSVDQIRFGVEAGISIAEYQEAHFYERVKTAWYDLNSNYYTNYSKSNSMGISFRLKVEFPLTRFWGMELAMISNINEYHSYAGLELHTTIGKVRD